MTAIQQWAATALPVLQAVEAAREEVGRQAGVLGDTAKLRSQEPDPDRALTDTMRLEGSALALENRLDAAEALSHAPDETVDRHLRTYLTLLRTSAVELSAAGDEADVRDSARGLPRAELELAAFARAMANAAQ